MFIDKESKEKKILGNNANCAEKPTNFTCNIEFLFRSTFLSISQKLLKLQKLYLYIWKEKGQMKKCRIALIHTFDRS